LSVSACGSTAALPEPTAVVALPTHIAGTAIPSATSLPPTLPPAPTSAPPTAPPTAPPAPTDTPVSQPPLATLTAELSATVIAALPPTPTPEPGMFGGSYSEIDGIVMLPLAHSGTGAPLFVAYSQGITFHQQHFVAIYAHEPNGWRELSRVHETCSEIDTVQLLPDREDRVWLQVYSTETHMTGGGCYQLLRFDGRTLMPAATSFSRCALQALTAMYPTTEFALPSEPNNVPGFVTDFDGDGSWDLLLNQTDGPGVGPCYFARIDILRHDATQLVTATLELLPATAPAQLREPVNQAVALAQAGLWKDAAEAIGQTTAMQSGDPIAIWDAILIRETARVRAGQLQWDDSVLPAIWYGDYDELIDRLRGFQPYQLFESPTPDALWEFSFWLPEASDGIPTRALQARPDLAGAYFLRGWAAFLEDPRNTTTLADIERAAQLDPQEPLFSDSLAYLTSQQ
jgi:hypothetical protein